MNIQVNNKFGTSKSVKLGFSWTVFFFGFFVPLFRGDMKWFGIMLGIGLLLAFLSSGLLGWLSSLFFSFFYNKLYATDLVNKGYTGTTPDAQTALGRYISS